MNKHERRVDLMLYIGAWFIVSFTVLLIVLFIVFALTTYHPPGCFLNWNDQITCPA